MELWIIIIVVVVAIFNFILFFKVWDMTTDTKKIRVLLEEDHPDLYWKHNRYYKKKETEN
tara:strand:- start:188 stop:367 length:180 start_codon:yes stop_codon:yes gene_type:complete